MRQVSLPFERFGDDKEWSVGVWVKDNSWDSSKIREQRATRLLFDNMTTEIVELARLGQLRAYPGRSSVVAPAIA